LKTIKLNKLELKCKIEKTKLLYKVQLKKS